MALHGIEIELERTEIASFGENDEAEPSVSCKRGAAAVKLKPQQAEKGPAHEALVTDDILLN